MGFNFTLCFTLYILHYAESSPQLFKIADNAIHEETNWKNDLGNW